MPCILSDHNGLRLDINNRNGRKYTQSYKLNNSPLNENRIKKKNQEGNYKSFGIERKGKYNIGKCMGHDEGSYKRPVH
ncbi:hypothetical protein ACQP3F_30890, partial [Escherichia coli]